MQIHNAWFITEDIGDFAEMGGKPDEGAGFNESFADSEGEGLAVMRGGAAPELVHDDEGMSGDIFEDEGGFAHFGREGGDIGFEGVVEGDAGEKLVRYGEGSVGSWDTVKASVMGAICCGTGSTYKEPICAITTVSAIDRRYVDY